MMCKTTYIASPLTNFQFAKDVAEGLITNPKYLNSKYFYDKNGDELFRKIMKLPEYYLTGSELEILENNKEKFLQLMYSGEDFNLLDLGAGDALKTQVLLKYFVNQNVNFTYVPVDISQNAIQKVTDHLSKEIPRLKIKGFSEEYLQAIESLSDQKRKIILFLGASIGNFSYSETINFLQQISSSIDKKDHLIIGFDLKKDPQVILEAYNDKAGVTKDFNLNLLHRINRELGADFDVNFFEHYPNYNAENGEARSALVSTKKQLVEIPALELSVRLKEGEHIHTEISRKYSLKEIQGLAEVTGFEIVENLMDSKKYFTDSIWRKINE